MLDMERNRLVLPNNDAHTAAGAAEGVDAIIIEGCTEEGLGLAVMERVRKAVGGGGILGDVADGQGSKEQGVFWVNLGV
jgi:L-threonylcarbamoyladenylate synthase